MAATDSKFSNFADGGDLEVNDIVVGLRNGVNTRFNNTGTPGLYLPLSGGEMDGPIDMDNNSITGLPTPTQPTDAVNKAYVDGITPTGSPLTRVDDANVTLTLGGAPATALLQAVSITAGWSGQLSPARGGTGVNNGSSTITVGGSFTMSGAFTFNGTLTGNTSVTFPTSGTLATVGQIPTGAALTRVDDTNVTLTLGGSPGTALVNAASITAGWNGQLSLARGGSNASLTASNGGIVYSTASAMAILAGTATAGQMLRSGASGAPSWSTATYPSTAGTTGNVLTSDGANWVSSPSASSSGRLLGLQVLTSSGTITANANANSWLIMIKGGGGGGAGGTVANLPGQGGSEGGICVVYAAVTPSTGYTYTQGAGGTAGTVANNGGNGGNSSLTIGATTYSGNGGEGGRALGYGSIGGSVTNQSYGIGGTTASTVGSATSSGSGAGAGARGAPGTTSTGTASAGNSGAGGSGGYGNNAGGAGGSGYLVVYEYS